LQSARRVLRSGSLKLWVRRRRL